MRELCGTPILLSLPPDPIGPETARSLRTELHTEKGGDKRAAVGVVQGWADVLFLGEVWSWAVGVYPTEALWQVGVAMGTGGSHREDWVLSRALLVAAHPLPYSSAQHLGGKFHTSEILVPGF